MNLLKYIALGAVAAYGISYIVKKRGEDGKSFVDDIADKAPEWMDMIKKYGQDAIDMVSKKTEPMVETVKTAM